MGAEYLLSRGFRRFAFLGVNSMWSQCRQAGFVDRIRDADPALNLPIKSLTVADFQFISKGRGIAALRKWVRGLPLPTALMAASDFAARTVVEAALAEGVRVPEDIAVLGVDNFHTICELSSVPLSSIAQDFAQLGFEAAALLDRLLSKEPGARRARILVPPGRIQVRSSTDVLAFEDSSVLEAIRIIHAHAATGISMKQLMKQVPLSRRWLDERFRKLVGRTASQEIRHCRLRYVQDLLADTDMPLRQIAARCQFSCTENFIRWFRAGAGAPPHAYRVSLQTNASRRNE
jgi:LacI family transcriptional regulator